VVLGIGFNEFDKIKRPAVEKQYPLTNDSYINWLNEVVRKLGLETVSLVGISLGGWMSEEIMQSVIRKKWVN